MKLTMVPLTMLLTRPMTPRSRYEIEYNRSRPSLKYLNQKYYEINALTYITNVLRKDFRCVFYQLSNIFLLHLIKPFSFIDWLSKKPLKHLKKKFNSETDKNYNSRCINVQRIRCILFYLRMTISFEYIKTR